MKTKTSKLFVIVAIMLLMIPIVSVVSAMKAPRPGEDDITVEVVTINVREDIRHVYTYFSDGSLLMEIYLWIPYSIHRAGYWFLLDSIFIPAGCPVPDIRDIPPRYAFDIRNI